LTLWLAMQATRVDPRDVQSENRQPTYRVYFWDHPQHASDEWRLTENSSVHEVLAWAVANAGLHRTYQIWVEAPDPLGRLEMILLAGGDDPSNGSTCR